MANLSLEETANLNYGEACSTRPESHSQCREWGQKNKKETEARRNSVPFPFLYFPLHDWRKKSVSSSSVKDCRQLKNIYDHIKHQPSLSLSSLELLAELSAESDSHNANPRLSSLRIPSN